MLKKYYKQTNKDGKSNNNANSYKQNKQITPKMVLLYPSVVGFFMQHKQIERERERENKLEFFLTQVRKLISHN